MNVYLKVPEFIKEARTSRRGHRLWLETLIFIAVFITSATLEGIPLVVSLLVRIFSSSEALSVFASGNTELIQTLLYSDDLYTIASLFSTIIMIATVIIYCRFIEKRKLRTMGFIKKDFILEYAAGLLIGAFLFSAAVLICYSTGTLTLNGISPSFAASTLMLFLLAYMVQGMSEEVLCRGYFMVSVSRKSSLVTAVLANSLVFGCLHLLNPGISVLSFRTFASVYMLRRGSIWGAAAIHSSWNFVQGNLFGVSVSGTGKTASLLSSTLSSGGTLINGGAFGLEGGLGVTIVLVLGIAATLLVPHRMKD